MKKAEITTWKQHQKRLAAISPLAQRILKKIKQDPSATSEEIGESAGCNKLTVNSTIPTLLNEGLLIEERGQLRAVVVAQPKKAQADNGLEAGEAGADDGDTGKELE